MTQAPRLDHPVPVITPLLRLARLRFRGVANVWAARVGAATVLALLSGCAASDPYKQPYTWHATGINQANLAAMVVDPHDLVHGHAPAPTDGASAVAAIDRLQRDHVKSLLDGSSASSTTSGSGSSSASSSGTTN